VQPDSGQSQAAAVGRNESVTDRTAPASASGSTRPRAVKHSNTAFFEAAIERMNALWRMPQRAVE